MKTKKIIQLLQRAPVRVVMVMVAVMISIGAGPLAAAKTKVPRIKVYMKDGAAFSGKLREVSGRTIVLFDDYNAKLFKAGIDEIKDLKILKKLKIGTGALVGLLAGAALVSSGSNEITKEYMPLPMILGGLMGASAGALCAIPLSPKSEHYHLHEMTGQEIDALLSLLENSLGFDNRESKTSPPHQKENSEIEAILSRCEKEGEVSVRVGLALNLNTTGNPGYSPAWSPGSIPSFKNDMKRTYTGGVSLGLFLKIR